MSQTSTTTSYSNLARNDGEGTRWHNIPEERGAQHPLILVDIITSQTLIVYLTPSQRRIPHQPQTLKQSATTSPSVLDYPHPANCLREAKIMLISCPQPDPAMHHILATMGKKICVSQQAGAPLGLLQVIEVLCILVLSEHLSQAVVQSTPQCSWTAYCSHSRGWKTGYRCMLQAILQVLSHTTSHHTHIIHIHHTHHISHKHTITGI